MSKRGFRRQFLQQRFHWHSVGDSCFLVQMLSTLWSTFWHQAQIWHSPLSEMTDAEEEVVDRCHTQPTQPAALRGLGRGFESNRFFSLATDSGDEEVERRTTIDEDSYSDTVSLIGRRNSRRRLRLRWSECVPIVAHSLGCEQETRVDTPDSHDERLRRVREAFAARQFASRGPSSSNIDPDSRPQGGGGASRSPFASCTQKIKVVTVECPAFMGRCWSGTV